MCLSFFPVLFGSLHFSLHSSVLTRNTPHSTPQRWRHLGSLFSFHVLSSTFSSAPRLRRLLCAFPAAAHQCVHSVDHPSAQQALLQLGRGRSKVGLLKKPFGGDTSGEVIARKSGFRSVKPLWEHLRSTFSLVFLRILLSLPS